MVLFPAYALLRLVTNTQTGYSIWKSQDYIQNQPQAVYELPFLPDYVLQLALRPRQRSSDANEVHYKLHFPSNGSARTDEN